MIQENENNRVEGLRLPSGVSFINNSHLEKTWEREACLNHEQSYPNIQRPPIFNKYLNER